MRATVSRNQKREIGRPSCVEEGVEHPAQRVVRSEKQPRRLHLSQRESEV
jgi:hypothetical protein